MGVSNLLLICNLLLILLQIKQNLLNISPGNFPFKINIIYFNTVKHHELCKFIAYLLLFHLSYIASSIKSVETSSKNNFQCFNIISSSFLKEIPHKITSGRNFSLNFLNLLIFTSVEFLKVSSLIFY